MRVVLPGQPGHPADDRFAEPVGAAGGAHEDSALVVMGAEDYTSAVGRTTLAGPIVALDSRHDRQTPTRVSHHRPAQPSVPGVDDGTRTAGRVADSLAGLLPGGCRPVVTTPHLLLPHLTTDAALDRELERHRRAFDELAAAAARADRICPSSGWARRSGRPTRRSSAGWCERTDVGLPGRSLLVEFGFDLQGNHKDVVREAADAGRHIVIAHPERYRYLPGA